MTPMVRLKRLVAIKVSNIDKKVVEGDVPVRLCNYTDVYYRSVILPDQEFTVATASPQQVAAFRLQRNDVIITKDSETAGDIGIPAYVGDGAHDLVCGYHLAIIRPSARQILGRFLFWSMTSAVVREQLAVVATGVTRYGLRVDGIGNAVLWCPDLVRQDAIAGFLDVETARIDAIVAKKRAVLGLLDERWSASVAARVLPAAMGEGHALRRAVESVIGGSWGSDRGEGEVDALCVRGTDFDTRRLGVDVTTAPVRSFRVGEFRRRSLVTGDLVIEKSGGSDAQPVGRVVQWSGEQAAVPTNFASRMRPVGDVDSRYLNYVFRSAYEHGVTRAWIKQTTGIQNLDLDGLLSERWPMPDRREQEHVAAELDDLRARIHEVRGLLEAQLRLLAEHRQALITASVTGELDVPGAAA